MAKRVVRYRADYLEGLTRIIYDEEREQIIKEISPEEAFEIANRIPPPCLPPGETERINWDEEEGKLSSIDRFEEVPDEEDSPIVKPQASTQNFLSAGMRINEVAKYLGVSEQTIRRWIKAGKLPHLKMGRAYLFLKRYRSLFEHPEERRHFHSDFTFHFKEQETESR